MGLLRGDGTRTTLWAEGSSTILNFVHAAKRRKRILVIASAVAVVLTAVVTFGVLRYVKAQAASRVVDGYSSLSRCLLGAPLAAGERASVRFRAMQLTALTNSDVLRNKDGANPWPDRCAHHALVLSEGLEGASVEGDAGAALLQSAKILAELLGKKDTFYRDSSAEVDKLFEDAAKAGLVLQPRPDLPAPPAAAKALTVDALLATSRVTDKPIDLEQDLKLEPHASATVRFLVTGAKDKRAPLLCTFTEEAAHCASLPAAMAKAASVGPQLVGTADDDAAPLVFAGIGGVDGIFRSDSGEKFGAAGAIGAFVASDGFAAVLAYDDDSNRLELLRTEGNKVRTSRVSPGFGFDLKNPADDAQMLWGHILFAGSGKDEMKLAAARVDPAGRGMGKVEQIGSFAVPPTKKRNVSRLGPRISGCQSSKSIVARVAVARASHLSFWQGSRWTKPVEVAGFGGKLSCHKNDAAITRIDSGQGTSALTAAITQHRCTAAGCRSKTVKMRQLLATEMGLAPSALLAAATIKGKLLVVWGAGQRGGIRMRMASVDQIAAASDVIVFDDMMEKTAVTNKSTLLDMRLLPAEQHAVLLLNTTAGILAVRISADGKATPAKVDWK